MTSKRKGLGATLLLAALGCGGGEPEPAHSVPIDQVPPKLMEVARKELPGLNFDRAYKIEVDGKDAYEIRGKDRNGKIREVEVSQDGKVIEVE
jgi:hypothetical protein